MENMENMKGDMGKMCKCPHHKVIPALIALFGLTFLLQATGTLSASAVSIIWPIILIVGGVAKMMSCKCC